MKTHISKEAKSLLRLATSWTDMSDATNAFRLYEASTDDTRNYHFLLSFVTCYGRPFLRRDGIGSLFDEYPNFPDFENEEMNKRHHFFLELRHLFFAHTTSNGVRITLIPPNVPNPDKQITRNRWDFNLGLRSFDHQAYKPYIQWAFRIVPEMMERFEKDIIEILPLVAADYSSRSVPFEIDTGAENFDFAEYLKAMTQRKSKRHSSDGSERPYANP